MQKFFSWLDETANISRENFFTTWLERIAFIFLILMILSAPHSIAATQISWLSGMLAWVVRLFIKPRPKFFRTPLDIALCGFAGWSVISSIFSYAPDISLDKLRGVALFLIFYFVINNLRSKRAAVFLAGSLIFSCMAAVVWTPVERIIGRGVQVSGLQSAGPLSKAVMVEDSKATGTIIKGYIKDDDTLLGIGKKKIFTPEEFVNEIEKNDVTETRVGRLDYEYHLAVKRDDLLSGNNAAERLGFETWKHNRSWRAAGFYGHFTTFAEVMQLIASLTLGIFIAFFKSGRGAGVGGQDVVSRESRVESREPEIEKSKIQNLKSKIVLGFCVAGMLLALLLTVTRASQAGFMVSAFVMVLIGASRKMFLTLAVVAALLALVGLFFLQQYRNVGFFDTQDNSITWRQTVYREGFNLWTANARNFTVGVGMDSIKRYACEWHLFNDCRLPIGHFHSTPLQLAVERGFPALLLWLWILWIYARTLWKGISGRWSVARERGGQGSESQESGVESGKPGIEKSAIRNRQSQIERGIMLGSLGGMLGFFTAGLVHYNLGDGEVAMVFYILMGLSVFVAAKKEENISRG